MVRRRRWRLAAGACLVATICSCATLPVGQPRPAPGLQPERQQPAVYEFRHQFAGGRARVTVVEVTLSALRVQLMVAEEPDGGRIARAWLQAGGTRGALVGATPFAADGTPAGVVYRAGVVHAAPRAPYWAVVFDGQDVHLVEQAALTLPPQGPAEQPAPQIVGGFYPLVLAGRAVADQFPGSRLRAARVAIAGRQQPPTLLVVAVDEAPLRNRPGPTTGELAALLVEMGCEWALNLDGGQSALLAIRHDGRTFVRPHVPFGWRRIGPVLLEFS